MSTKLDSYQIGIVIVEVASYGSRVHELNDKAGNLSCPKIHVATWTYILLARGKVIDFLGFKKNVALFGNWRDGGKVGIVKLVW